MNIPLTTYPLTKLLFFDLIVGDKIELTDKEQELFDWQKSKLEGEDYYTSKPIFKVLEAVSLSYFNEDDNDWRVDVTTGTEEEICKGVIKKLQSKAFDAYKLIGWNIGGHKLPFLRLKATSKGVNYLGVKYNDSGRKPWELGDITFDLLPIISGSYHTRMSFEETCAMYRVECLNSWEEYDDIEQFAESRAKSHIDLYTAITKPEELAEETKVENKKGIFNKIYDQGVLMNEDKKKLKKMAASMTAKEKGMLCDIIQAATLQKSGKFCNEINK